MARARPLDAGGAVLLHVDAVADPLVTERRVSGPGTWAPVWPLLRESGWLLALANLLAFCAVAAGTVLEALLFRGLFDLGRHLPSALQRLSVMGAMLAFLMVLIALDWPATRTLFRLGRCLEVQLRTRLLSQVPALGDARVHSSLRADVAFRLHSLHLLRQLPEAEGYGTYLVSSLLITSFAVDWLYVGSGALIGTAVIAAFGVPALYAPAMARRDLKYREACIAALVHRQIAVVHSPAGLLLLIYWSMSVPLLGRELATLVRRFPSLYKTLRRYAELSSTTAEAVPRRHTGGGPPGVRIGIDAATVVVGGHTVLDRITMCVAPGNRVN